MPQLQAPVAKDQEEVESNNGRRHRRRCLRSCCQPPFSLFEDEDESAVVDIPRTFAPTFGGGSLIWGVLLLKVVLFALASAYVIWASTNLTEYGDDEPSNAFFLVYLTNWGAMLTALYLLSSVACYLAKDTALLQQPEDPLNDRPSWLVRTTWFLGALVYPMQVTIVLLFWALIYKGQKLNPLTLGGHGGEFILIFIDVVLVNNVPIRWSHFIFLEIAGVIVLIWTLIFAAAGIDDGVVYHILDWGEKPGRALVFAFALIFIFAPLCFLLAWSSSLLPQFLSRYCCRSSTTTRRRVIVIEKGDVEISMQK